MTSATDDSSLEFLRRPNSVSDLRAEPTIDEPSAPNGQPAVPKITAPEPVTAPVAKQAQNATPAPVEEAPAPPANMSYADIAAKGPEQKPEDK